MERYEIMHQCGLGNFEEVGKLVAGEYKPELLQGYPTEATHALLIAVVTEKPIGAILLHNKIGTFDSKDMMAARIFAGFLPNLLAWHVK